MVGDSVQAGISVPEVGEDGKDHARDTSLATTCPLRPGAVIDTTVALETSVEENGAGLVRLSIVDRKTKVTEKQHSVSGGNPLWRIKACLRRGTACPGAFEILSGQQASAPAGACDLAALSFDGAIVRPNQIPQRLPTDGWVPAKKPWDCPIGP